MNANNNIPTNGSLLQIPISLKWETLDKIANERLGALPPFRFSQFEVVAESIQLSGNGELLAAKINLAGTLTGVMSLAGKLYFDNAQKVIGLRDVTTDFKAGSTLQNWAIKLFRNTIEQKIEERLRFPIQPLLKPYNPGSQTIGPGLVVHYELDDLSVNELTLTISHLSLQAVIRGQVKID